MKRINICQISYEFDEPLLLKAFDDQNKIYVGVSLPSLSEKAQFVFTAVDTGSYERFLLQELDLRYLLTKKVRGLRRVGVADGYAFGWVPTLPFKGSEDDFLPRPGFFMPKPEVGLADAAREIRTIKIDGQWGLDDLKYFSDRLQDSYAFSYALQTDDIQAKAKMHSLFKKYPWRGGYSSLNFFDSIYGVIPRSDSAKIRKIQYASPGEIDVEVNSAVASYMGQLIAAISQDGDSFHALYYSTQNVLKLNKWLGRSITDVKLSGPAVATLKALIAAFADKLMLGERLPYINSLASEDPLAAIKILLSFYRKLNDLAAYVATGKARDIFAHECGEQAA